MKLDLKSIKVENQISFNVTGQIFQYLSEKFAKTLIYIAETIPSK